jgi:putative iron-regulated protein
MKFKFLPICLIFIFISCKKNDDSDDSSSAVLEKKVLTDFTHIVALSSYSDLNAKASELNNNVVTLDNQPTDANLLVVQNQWRTVRESWEQCEGWLFGPVEDLNFDPEMDDWPVNRVDLDSLLVSTAPLDLSAVQGFQTSLKGFHALEYIIFGIGGSKTAAHLTAREREYMKSLAQHIFNVTTQVYQSWDPGQPDNFSYEVINAGEGSARYATRKDAFIAIISAMAGICNEVAGGKMETPLVAQDSTLEESQFSRNSIVDFKNNITGVENVFHCRYVSDGTGFEEWLAAKNISLNNKIKQQIGAAVASFDNITLPFGQAIYTQQLQIINSQNAINALKITLEDELIPFVKANVHN